MSRTNDQRTRSLRALCGLLALAAVGSSACSASPVSPPAAVSTPAPITQAFTPYPTVAALPTYEAPPTTEAVAEVVSDTYTYKVTGKNRGSITFSNTGGNTSQVTSAKLPWSKSVGSPGFSGMTFAYVSAQNSGGGTISCQIVGPSGEVISENSSEGAYAIVTCQA